MVLFSLLIFGELYKTAAQHSAAASVEKTGEAKPEKSAKPLPQALPQPPKEALVADAEQSGFRFVPATGGWVRRIPALQTVR
jgi:hypothetical protein